MGRIWRNLPYLLKRTLWSAIDDGCFSMAKGAAYSALLSFFPILTSAAAILVETHAGFAARELAGFLSRVLPPGTDTAVAAQLKTLALRPKPPGLLAIACVLSLWAASSVIKSLMEGFNIAYRVPRRPSFWHETGIALVLVIAAIVPLLAASVLVLFGRDIEAQVLHIFKVDPDLNSLTPLWEILSRVARYVVSFVAMVILTIILYYYGPYRKQSIVDVAPGAILATLLWLAATTGFGWYVRNISNYNVLYGSIGSGIALLVWMYLLSAITILGCEFNAEYERMRELE